MISVALFQPDIPQNVGAAMRLCACMNTSMEIIEPCAFPWKEREFRRTGLDYVDLVKFTRHSSWNAFKDTTKPRRIVLLTTKAAIPYTDFKFSADDILLAGSESNGAPNHVHEEAAGRILVPLHPGLRSLNVVNTLSMVLGEALRQTGQFTVTDRSEKITKD